MTDFKIRPGRSEDAQAIADAHIDSRREAMPWLPVLHSRAETIIYFAEQVLAKEEVLVAEVNRIVVGFVALEGELIDHLYVSPGYQRRRIGDELLAAAKRLRPKGLRLWTFQRNLRARRFYEARGFKVSELTDGSRSEEGEPDALYVWSPAPTAACT